MAKGVGAEKGVHRDNPTWALAEFTVGLRWEAIPAPVREGARLHFLDAMALSIYGSLQAQPKALGEWAGRRFAPGRAHVFSRPHASGGLQPSGAAFANTFAGRAHTFDDTHEGAVIHPGVPLFMTGLAVAEEKGATGRELLAAALAGYDVAVRLAEVVMPGHYDRGFHTTGTFNTLGTAAVAAKLYGHSVSDLFGAINLAAEHAAGLRQYQVDGDILQSALHGARAAQLGCESAQLVTEACLPSSPAAVGGKLGLWATMGDPPADPSPVLAGLGRDFRIMDTGIKPYASCRYVHGAVAAILECLSRHALEAKDMAAVEVETFALAADECNRPEIDTTTDAQFSIQYNVARVLASGGIHPAHFAPHAVEELRRSPILRQVSVREAPDLTARYPHEWPYRATIRTRDGRRWSHEVTHPPGARQNPLGAEAVRAKARDLLRQEGEHLEPVVDMCLGIEDVDDVTRFVREVLDQCYGRRAR